MVVALEHVAATRAQHNLGTAVCADIDVARQLAALVAHDDDRDAPHRGGHVVAETGEGVWCRSIAQVSTCRVTLCAIT